MVSSVSKLHPYDEKNNRKRRPMLEVQLPNPNLDTLESDHTFHLDIPLNHDTARVFADTKFVCIGGTPSRMRASCVRIANDVYGKSIDKNEEFDYFFENERYSGYKVGAVFCVNHGMGVASLSIMMHELFKLLRCAHCSDVTIIRIGTCGGVGILPGTVIITEEAFHNDLTPFFHTSNFGSPLSLPVKSDQSLINQLKCVADTDPLSDISVVSAKTYCVDDFYQGQGRLDGSFCDKTETDKQEFLTKLYDLGVRNIEMESAGVLALTHRVGIKAAVVCVSLLDRFQSDLVTSSPGQIREWVDRPIRLVVQLIRSKLVLG